ncbi:hypothetical protein AJ78_02778 [Emergomyces pasteurianus Ep9510]|uniref:GAG-pre-integrase domain-containing protein n=1 Tax=Emergomyces pasteurianus Ep9510 TaxID=1447872 RepID=A0A1J9QPF0_9EURO|nr:hypothetical protein AJ78_02778 [Emergomyces pasteurianus Ep9510]
MLPLNVAYVPGFHTNLAASPFLKKKGLGIDELNHSIIDRDEVVQFNLISVHEKYVLEYKPLTEENAFAIRSALPRPPINTTAALWNGRLAHAWPEALAHIPAEIAGSEINGPKTSECETCVLVKMHNIISQRPKACGNRPFEILHCDIIYVEEAYNGRKYIAHLYDPYTHMHRIGLRNRYPHHSYNGYGKMVYFSSVQLYTPEQNEAAVHSETRNSEDRGISAQSNAHEITTIKVPESGPAGEIIESRDVIFDENTFFDPHNLPDEDVLESLIPNVIPVRSRKEEDVEEEEEDISLPPLIKPLEHGTPMAERATPKTMEDMGLPTPHSTPDPTSSRHITPLNEDVRDSTPQYTPGSFPENELWNRRNIHRAGYLL